MSDYLWDKTGEPEADVEQLENLLGALKYEPRPLDIPASAMPTAKVRPATMFLSRSRLAIAASLLLTLLAGTWFASRQMEQPPDVRADVRALVNKGSDGGGSSLPPQAVAAMKADENPEHASVNSAVTAKRQEDKAVEVKAATHDKRNRAPRQFVATHRKVSPRVDEKMAAPRELVATNGAMRWEVDQPLTPEQQAATEQLMLALRVASAKFNYAQREMQEIGRAGK